MRDVTQVTGGSVDGFDRQTVQLGDGVRRAIHLDREFGLANFGRARRQGQVLGVDGGNDVIGCQAIGLQRGRVQIDGDGAAFATIRVGHGGPRDGHQAGAQEVDRRVEQGRLGQGRAGQAQLNHRNAGGRVFDDEGRHGAGGQLTQHRLFDGRDLGDRGLDVGVGLKEHLDHRHTGKRLRLNVFNVIDRGGQDPLVHSDDAVAHFLG